MEKLTDLHLFGFISEICKVFLVFLACVNVSNEMPQL